MASASMSLFSLSNKNLPLPLYGGAAALVNRKVVPGGALPRLSWDGQAGAAAQDPD
jgi:hypothetical protein